LSSQDGYQLAVELESAWQESVKSGAPMDIVSSLKRYEKERRLCVAIIHGLARMAAIMATVYIPHSGVGLEPLALLTKSSRLLIKYGMDMMLSWVLTGNSSKLEGRPLRCLLSDKANDKLYQWLEDDDAMEEAMGGECDLHFFSNYILDGTSSPQAEETAVACNQFVYSGTNSGHSLLGASQIPVSLVLPYHCPCHRYQKDMLPSRARIRLSM